MLTHYHTWLHRPNPPSQQAGALPCASGGAWAGRVSRDEEAGPVWAAPTGAPRTPRATEARSTTARTEAERSWSRHTGLRAASRALVSAGKVTETIRDSETSSLRDKFHMAHIETSLMGGGGSGELHSLSLVDTGRIRRVLELRFLMAIVSWKKIISPPTTHPAPTNKAIR